MPPDYVAAQMKAICTEGDYILPPQIRNLTSALSRSFPTKRNITNKILAYHVISKIL